MLWMFSEKCAHMTILVAKIVYKNRDKTASQRFPTKHLYFSLTKPNKRSIFYAKHLLKWKRKHCHRNFIIFFKTKYSTLDLLRIKCSTHRTTRNLSFYEFHKIQTYWGDINSQIYSVFSYIKRWNIWLRWAFVHTTFSRIVQSPKWSP